MPAKNEMLNIRLSERERQTLTVAARKSGCNGVSTFIRRAALSVADNGSSPTAPLNQKLDQLIWHCREIVGLLQNIDIYDDRRYPRELAELHSGVLALNDMFQDFLNALKRLKT